MAKIIELHISTITRKRCFIFYFKNYVQLIGSIIHSREFYLNRNIVNGKNKEYPFISNINFLQKLLSTLTMYNNIDDYEELILFMYISDSDYDKIRSTHQLVQSFHSDKSWNTFKEIIIKYINDEKILELFKHL